MEDQSWELLCVYSHNPDHLISISIAGTFILMISKKRKIHSEEIKLKSTNKIFFRILINYLKCARNKNWIKRPIHASLLQYKLQTYKPSQFLLLHLFFLDVHIRFSSQCELTNIWSKKNINNDQIFCTIWKI